MLQRTRTAKPTDRLSKQTKKAVKKKSMKEAKMQWKYLIKQDFLFENTSKINKPLAILTKKGVTN